MKRNILFAVFSCLLLFSCSPEGDKLILKDLSIEKYIEEEKSLKSEILPVDAQNKKALAYKFVPKDTSLHFVKVASYRRLEYDQLPLSSSAYEDSLGNFLVVYVWDKITPEMSLSEREKIKREFDKHHEDYVSKYNQLTDELTAELGAPKLADKKLQASEMEVYKFWESNQIWEKDKQIIELNLVLAPNETYRVIVKVLALKE